MDITIKSTGFLIDELITTQFKVTVQPENITRARLLQEAVDYRLQDKAWLIQPYYERLQQVLKDCWDAQEIIMKAQTIEHVALAAYTAQSTNRKRNELIRTIDSLLGESAITPLSKTYGQTV